MTAKLCILSCASFDLEASLIAQEPGLHSVTFKTYQNRCGRPPMTWDDMRDIVENPEGYDAIWIFGGCCLSNLQEPPADLQHCRITHLEHCFELIAGKAAILQLVSKGVYLVSSGWLTTWRQRLTEWGFSAITAREFFAECSRKIVLLDTTASEMSLTELEQFSAYVDLPYETIPVGLDQMRLRMALCLETVRGETARKAEQLARRQLSDYAMAFDLLSTLARSVDEADVIRQTVTLYQMLFAASEVAFIRFCNGSPHEVIYTDFESHADSTQLIQEAAELTGEYGKFEALCGFLLRVNHGAQTLGVVRISGIAFPEYVDTYLNLALATIGVCGLALHNATLFNELVRKNSELEQTHSELKNTHIQLLQQEKMASIGQLAAGIAHEINNPMGFITSNLGTLDKYLSRITEYLTAADRIVAASALPERDETTALRSRLKLDYIVNDAHQLIEESLDGTTRVKNIVDDLKNLSRTDKQEMIHADLNKIIETALNMAGNEIKYVADVDKQISDIPSILCHPQQLSQVFINLLINACHAMDGHGTITIRSWHTGDSAFISVRDTGSGIPEAALNRIFEPFFTTKEVGKGTGLGLSISYDILQKHGGDISVESTPGHGSVFLVRLPVDTTAVPPRSHHA